LTQDPAKPLDINTTETALDELLECYRQALRAVEWLPSFSRVPKSEYSLTILPPVDQKRSRTKRPRTPSLPARTRYADWIKSRFAVRPLARMFLRSHIRSKLRDIADRLKIEQFASGHMDASTSKRLDYIIRKLRTYDKSLTQRRTFWLKLPGWIWPIAASLLTTYLGNLAFSHFEVTASAVLVYIATYLLVIVMLVYLPLFSFFTLGGFRWKRIILLGQSGDVNIEIATNAVLRWVPAPQENAYEYEDRFFRILGLPKSKEFPWDLLLTPHIFLGATLALALFLVALASAIAITAPNWLILIPVVFFVLSLLCFRFTLRIISKVMRDRKQRSAC
jgi:hypothetical protein